jgi:hypothetical protein
MPQVTRRRLATAVLAAGALGASSLTLAFGASGAQAAATAGRVMIAGTHPSWAVSAHRTSSRSMTTGTVSARVYLAPRDQAGMAAQALAESTPGNPSYRHFLSPAQVQSKFGATAAQVNSVKSWLTKSGLKVTRTSNHVADGYVAVRAAP